MGGHSEQQGSEHTALGGTREEKLRASFWGMVVLNVDTKSANSILTYFCPRLSVLL